MQNTYMEIGKGGWKSNKEKKKEKGDEREKPSLDLNFLSLFLQPPSRRAFFF